MCDLRDFADSAVAVARSRHTAVGIDELHRGGTQIILIDRLHQAVRSAVFHRLDGGANIVPVDECQKRRVRVPCFPLLHQFQATELGRFQIANHQADRIVAVGKTAFSMVWAATT